MGGQWGSWEGTDERCSGGRYIGLSAYTHVELPYYSKFILIAAYLASYNPARTDRRFFLKVIVTSVFLKNPSSTVILAGSNIRASKLLYIY